MCADLAATPLDPAHPLWQLHLIEHHEGGCALIARIHHCIGDGIALISVMNSITDGGAAPPRRRSPQAPHEAHEAHDGDWLSDAVIKPRTDLAVRALDRSGSGVARTLDLLAGPKAPAAKRAGHLPRRPAGGR